MDENSIKYIRGEMEDNIDLQTLRKLIAEILQIENLSFFIGAGCSSNIVNGQETGIPIMSGLHQKFFNENQNFSVNGISLKDKFDNNLEKLMEFLLAVNIVNNEFIKEKKAIDNQITEKISLIKKFLLQQVKQGLKSDNVKNLYKTFYFKISQRNRKNPINIYTTNYDLFNEMALDELGFPYNNGFIGTYKRKFSPKAYNYIYVENMNLNKSYWERVPTFYNIIKLHGSISWIKNEEEIIERDYENIKEDALMIYPTPMKDRTTLMVPYSDMFRIMENQLAKKNSTLLVMGYSFSDEHINRIILNALAVSSFNLVILGNSDNIIKLQKLKDNRITIIYSADKIHYFENIVNKVLPNMYPDIVEEKELKDITSNLEKIIGELNE